MAYLVEDGTGVAGANSYDTVANFKTHHLDRGQIDSAAEFSDTEIEVGLVLATDYEDKRFGQRFKGWKRTRSQDLEWPRTDAFDNDGHLFDPVPRQLLKGTHEYALIAMRLERNLAPIPGMPYGIVDPETGTVTTEASGLLTKSTDVIGPIEETREYESTADSTPMTSTGNLIQRIPEYPQADLWIEELLRGTMSRTLLRG